MATVGSILEGAFGLIRRRPGAVAIWGLTYLLGSVAIGLGMAGMIAATGSVPTGEPGVMPGGGFFGAILVVYLLYALLSVVLINAVYRAILRPRETAFASMRVGSDEFRMLGLAVLFVVGIAILYMISGLGLMAMTAGLAMVAQSSPFVGVGLGFLMMLGFFCFWVWLTTRLSLIFPMTFHRRRFAIDEGWALGRGRFWTLFGAYLVVWVLILVVTMVFFYSQFSELVALMGTRGDPAANQEVMRDLMTQNQGGSVATTIVKTLGISVIALIGFVLGYGVVGSAARELLNEQGDVTEDEADLVAEIFE